MFIDHRIHCTASLRCLRAALMLSAAADMNQAMAKTLGAIDPRLGAIFNASSDATVNEMMRQITTSGQDAVERYFQASNNKLVRWPGGKVHGVFPVGCL